MNISAYRERRWAAAQRQAVRATEMRVILILSAAVVIAGCGTRQPISRVTVRDRDFKVVLAITQQTDLALFTRKGGRFETPMLLQLVTSGLNRSRR